GLLLAAAEDHVAVQVVAPRGRGPFEADERGESARLVVLLGGSRLSLPHRSGERVVALEGVVARAQALDPFVERFDALARLDQVVHLATPLRFQQLRIRAGELRRKT